MQRLWFSSNDCNLKNMEAVNNSMALESREPVGLQKTPSELNNTCFLNAGIQFMIPLLSPENRVLPPTCLLSAPEHDNDNRFLRTLEIFLSEIKSARGRVPKKPNTRVAYAYLRTKPWLLQKDQNGMFKQQDASE